MDAERKQGLTTMHQTALPPAFDRQRTNRVTAARRRFGAKPSGRDALT